MKAKKLTLRKKTIATFNSQPKSDSALILLSLHPICTRAGMY
ncbi:hypothetical protein SAMN04488109_6876 [Chryseolinea serpens]|uniref:Uncharacterized protein n=1 Tax=Chryseolinea serpens TaxID=947013 RepID=A0A1M5XTY4_9BACT|nr:hypothetical protein SAMN04488109_6876 [Chryseolinea serpens]